MQPRTFRILTSVLGVLAAVLVTGGFFQPSSALSASCVSKLETKVLTLQPDEHRAGAYCTSIGSDTYVRAKLVRNGGPDANGVWFTATRSWKYTGWRTCWYGCWDTYELKPR